MSVLVRRPLSVLNSTIPQVVRDALVDPQRLTPMLAGASCIRQARGEGLLVVRTVGADVEIRAPKTLLDQVFEHCDGTRTVQEVLERIQPEEARSELADFIAFLFQEGALIDANLVCAQAVRYGFQFSPFGLAAPASVSHQVCLRFAWNPENAPACLPQPCAKVPAAPLDSLFESRITQYTFDDKPISVDVLHQLLWSAAGVVRTDHPRIGQVAPQRTLASAGGMHLLTIFVALRRQVGPYSPGVYRVDYPGERLVSLQCVNDDMASLPLAFSKPWQLAFATGALFVVADPAVGAVRYRNRSLQYLFMEAGAALHNVALSAHGLGLGQATIGGYYERTVSRLCRLDQELVLGSAIFGAQATTQQIADQSKSPDVDFAWVNVDSARYNMGFHMARAKIKSESDDRPHTWGRDTDPLMAVRKAVAEAIEREGYKQPRNIERGILADFKNAIDPRCCIAYTEAQYSNAAFPYARFNPAAPYAWTKGNSLANGRSVHVLAELVFSRASLAQQGHDMQRPVTQVNSSGCAAGISVDDATERALRELVERDAFMRHWLTQTPGRIVPPQQWPSAIRDRMEAMTRTGCRVQLQQFVSPWLHVAMVAVRHDDQHFTTLGMSASHSFTLAAEGALDETESRVYAWLHGHAATIIRPEQVDTPEHHFELYGLKKYYRRADRVLFPASAETTGVWPRALKAESLEAMVRRFVKAGREPLAIDITPDKHWVDQGRTPLSVIKVMVPGLLPISFGYQKEPLGMVAEAHSGACMPHPFP